MSIPLSPGRSVPVRVALVPVYNILNSFALLSSTEHLPGLNTWVVQTATALTPERRHINRLVFEGLRDALILERDAPDFPTYLKQLSEENPLEISKRVLERLSFRFSRHATDSDLIVGPGPARLLSDVQAYLTCVEYVQVDVPLNTSLQIEAHALLNDPPALHKLLVSHLHEMWQMFASEWKRVQSSLRWQVEMFTHSLNEEATIAETFHTFTGRELPPDFTGRLNNTSEIILVPSWHVGRNVTLWDDGVNVKLFFSEPPNYDVAALRSTPMGRAELRARLDALADETRLHILELLVQQDEMSAQDIIAALDLSQSNVSRHLKQLVSMKYLHERRGEGANKTYRLSSFYFDRTARAIEQLVSGESTRREPQTEISDETQSKELRRFLDRRGRLTMWPPAKQRDKLLILEYLARFFEQERVYSEKEVNDLLHVHSTFEDAAALRRALYEYRFMNRTRDGSQYWLIGMEVSE